MIYTVSILCKSTGFLKKNNVKTIFLLATSNKVLLNSYRNVIFSSFFFDFQKKRLPLQRICRNIDYKKMEKLDETDWQILRTLQRNAKLTTKELADAVHLTPTPVFERQKRLERQGYIKKYVAVLNAEKCGQGLLVFCKVKLKQINHEIADAFVRRIQRISEVTECYNTSGAYDYLLKVRARDMKHYQEFVLNKLGEIESLASIESTFVMDEVKQTYGLNI